ncbi:MAG: hypothetical protein DRJ49_07585 [Thermoprotei archaeon]|nr:MAG: hypothetical protein DRJ49_07585 [Thermoprotei archaeon]
MKYKDVIDIISDRKLLQLLVLLGDEGPALVKKVSRILRSRRPIKVALENGLVRVFKPNAEDVIMLSEKGERVYRILKELIEVLS